MVVPECQLESKRVLEYLVTRLVLVMSAVY